MGKILVGVILAVVLLVGQATAESQWIRKDSISFKSGTVSVGDTFDETLLIIPGYEMTNLSPLGPDGIMKGGVHEGVNFKMRVARREDPGPYRVIEIYVVKNTPSQKTETQSPSIKNKPQASLGIDSFLSSPFATKYGIKQDDGWPLKNGLYNNSLSISSISNVMLEASTKNSIIKHFGITFFETTTLSDEKLSMVTELISTLAPGDSQKTNIKNDIKKSIATRVSQINHSKPRKYGDITVYTANVGGDAVVSIDIN